MKQNNLFIFLGTTVMLAACQLSITPTPATINPEPNRTVQPTENSRSTQAACPRETVPASLLGPEQPGLNTGKLIAYNIRIEDFSYEIYLSDWDGTNRRNITNTSANDVFKQWSPDGKQILFLSNRNSPFPGVCWGDCMYELYIMNPDGTGLMQLSKDATSSPSWSPDGTRIAFISSFVSDDSLFQHNTFINNIFIISPDGSNLLNLTNSPGTYSFPLWHPDGEKIAFTLREKDSTLQNINIIDLDGALLFSYPTEHIYNMKWSLNGKSLLFSSLSDNTFNEGQASGCGEEIYHIYQLNIDSSMLEQLTFTRGNFIDMMVFSPDGRWLAYDLTTDQTLDNSCYQIRVLNMETRQDYFLYDLKDIQYPTQDTVTGLCAFDWTRDSRELKFTQCSYVSDFVESERSFSIQLDGIGFQEMHTGSIGVIQP